MKCHPILTLPNRQTLINTEYSKPCRHHFSVFLVWVKSRQHTYRLLYSWFGFYFFLLKSMLQMSIVTTALNYLSHTLNGNKYWRRKYILDTFDIDKFVTWCSDNFSLGKRSTVFSASEQHHSIDLPLFNI